MKLTRPFQFLGELILVEVKLRGPRSESVRNLVLDTGAAATTLIPEVIEDLGYSARDGTKLSRVHSAIGEEHGYFLNVAEISALGVATPNFTVNVFDLDHEGLDGVLRAQNEHAVASGCSRRMASYRCSAVSSRPRPRSLRGCGTGEARPSPCGAHRTSARGSRRRRSWWRVGPAE